MELSPFTLESCVEQRSKFCLLSEGSWKNGREWGWGEWRQSGRWGTGREAGSSLESWSVFLSSLVSDSGSRLMAVSFWRHIAVLKGACGMKRDIVIFRATGKTVIDIDCALLSVNERASWNAFVQPFSIFSLFVHLLKSAPLLMLG